jgi:chitin disaccharide deacetylase
MTRHLIVNADDLGASSGINRGILECHREGILTSASLMVTGAAAEEAVELARASPELSLGLHWDVIGEDERSFDLGDERAVRDEFDMQLSRFVELVGRPPTHIDSHRHLHLEDDVREVFAALVAPLGVPLRGDGRVRFIGGFYAQWEWGVTELEHVCVGALEKILREELCPGWTEVSCHPGYLTEGYSAMYHEEREAEVRTLTDGRLRALLDELGIALESYATLAAASR